MADHLKFVALAQRLIKENGREVTLVQFDGVDEDSDEPWLGPDDPRSATAIRLDVDAVFIPPSGVSSLGLETRTQDLFKDSDQVLIFSAGAQVEVGGFNVVDDGVTPWKIDVLDVLRPGVTTILAYAGVSR